ncbi:uncharacterized protein LOC129938348 [Eupeodes corollae]|uniref:uncharacterized protein LOC129938348 n=1 Tax=Eupeodes corollae TaxID=290404 RepID=UPI0024939333|nr:uncharacterized protein LOC129938348 [Eupeodes corollae]
MISKEPSLNPPHSLILDLRRTSSLASSWSIAFIFSQILKNKTSATVYIPSIKMQSATIFTICVYMIIQIAPTNQRIIEDDSLNLTIDGDSSDTKKNSEISSSGEMVKTVTYHRASTPTRILECITRFSILRCSKLFVLQKMEERQVYPRTGNLTKDFLEQFFGGEDDEMGMDSLVEGKLAEIPDDELTQRVIWQFQRFFKNRNIQLHFLPGVKVKIVPSKENKLKLSLKRNKRRNYQDIGTGRGKGDRKKIKKKSKHSYKDLMIQMAVPVMVMPAVLLGTFLPFILPAIKMATFMSTIMNNSAFLAALLYAARTHVMNSDNNEAQPVMYSPHGGFH